MAKLNGCAYAIAGLALLSTSACTQFDDAGRAPVSASALMDTALQGFDNRIDMVTLPIALKPRAPNDDTAGQLVYRGGIYLHSRDERFGGISGLLVSDDGSRLMAISDHGYWFTGELLYKNGRLSGLRNARLAPMLGLEGEALSGNNADAESLASADFGQGKVYVSFERNHRLWAYPFDQGGSKSKPIDIPLPSDAHRAAINGGIEGMALANDNTLLAVTEDFRDRKGDFTGWLIPLKEKDPDDATVVFVRAMDGYHPTDLARLPNGDMLLLERKFTLERGAAMQLRIIPKTLVKPLGILDGNVIAQLDVNYSIDNMEALAVRKGEGGETLIYVMSDDNYNGLQRTVLLTFELK